MSSRRIDTFAVARRALVPLLASAATAVLAAALATSVRADEEAPGRPPSLLFVLLDDVGYADLGAYGSTRIETPHIDSLARQGMRFTRAYSNSPVCSPARAAILTGRHPSEFGLRGIIGHEGARGIPPDVPTLATWLRGRGYATGHFGKWHLGMQPEHLPSSLGFEHSVIRTPKDNGPYFDPLLLIDGRDTRPTQGHLSELTTDHAIAFIERNRARPFFANVWYHAPHVPHQPPAAWAARYPNDASGRYAALLSHVDFEIGRLLAALEALDLADDTLVILTDDNGGAKGEWAEYGGLRGGKGVTYEAGIRVPLIVRWPGRVKAGSTSDALVAGFDFFPTFAEILAVQDSATTGLSGRSFLPALQGKELPPRRELLVWERMLDFAVRDGDWKLLQRLHWRSESEDGGDVLKTQLFDLSSDPNERSDLSRAQPERVQSLLAAYAEWRLRTGRFQHEIAEVQGDAAVEGEQLRFDGGRVELAANTRFDVEKGDFSLSFRLRLSEPERTSPQTILHRDQCFHLWLDADGRLQVDIRTRGGEPGTRLASLQPIDSMREHEVVLAITGYAGRKNRVRLYVDGILQQESQELPATNSNHQPVFVGATAQNEQPLHGTVSGLRFYLLTLNPGPVPSPN